jgi:hypothetical protein
MDVVRGVKVLDTQMKTLETKLRLQIKKALIMMNVTMIKPKCESVIAILFQRLLFCPSKRKIFPTDLVNCRAKLRAFKPF